jgi:hypothetical protein
MDLIVSRGSIFFWKDLPMAFKEIHCVLAPDGWAYVGGGFGSQKIKESIIREMSTRNQGSDQFQQLVRPAALLYAPAGDPLVDAPALQHPRSCSTVKRRCQDLRSRSTEKIRQRKRCWLSHCG